MQKQSRNRQLTNRSNGTPLLYMWTCHDMFASPSVNKTCEPQEVDEAKDSQCTTVEFQYGYKLHITCSKCSVILQARCS